MIIESKNKRPWFVLNIGGGEIPREAIKEVSVTLSIVAMSELKAVILTHKDKFPRIDFNGLFKYGEEASVSMGYFNDCEPIFKGILINADPEFPADGDPTLTITAYDQSAILKKSGEKKNFNNKTVKGLLEEILNSAGITLEEIDGDVANLKLNDRILQGSENDLHIISTLVEKYGKFFWIDKGKAYFTDPTKKEMKEPRMVFYPLQSEIEGPEEFLVLNSFSPGLKIYELIYKIMTRLEVMADDNVIEDDTEQPAQPIVPLGSKTAPSIIEEAMKLAAKRYYLEPITKEEFSDAKKLSELLANYEFLKLIQGEGNLREGYNKLKPGEIREMILHGFPDVDQAFSGRYLISEVTHRIFSEGYSTSFRFLRNALNG